MMSRWLTIVLLVALAIVAANNWLPRATDGSPGWQTDGASPSALAGGTSAGLPPEALGTLAAIVDGGPFPYDRDGTVFQNREERLPGQPRGYYREYTVMTPGSPDRGARRIVSGGQPPEVFYYTDDHYRTFRRVEVPR